MSSVPKTEAGFLQESQSKAEHSDAHSALFYLFQEVSKLASPNHPGVMESDPSSKGLNDASKREIFKNEREEEDENSHQASCSFLEDSSVFENDDQHSLPCMFPYNDEPREHNSPWKVLNLINLHCERILHQKDEKLSSAFISSTKSCNVMTALAAADEREGIQWDGTSEPSLPVRGRRQHAAFSTQDLDLTCSGHRRKLQECSVHVQMAETMGLFTAKLQEDGSALSLQPLSSYKEESSVHKHLEWDQERTKEGHLENALQQTQNPDAHLNAQMTFGSNVCADLSKPWLTLDHNANITLPTVLLPLQSETHTFIPSDSGQSLSEQNDHTSSKPKCSQTPTEEKSPAGDQLNSSSWEVSSGTSPSELWMVQTEEINPPAHRCRPRTQRKQPHPSRSADIQDPDFQGVTFRINAELDDTREQCRLLITSKYSKGLCKSVRKPKLRTRPSQKSLKTSSSEEENDLTANATKGKVCASCCTRKTPMWRDAEDGTPLCNACGIRYKKYRVRCVKCWHIPRKEGNSNSCCLKCGNFVKLTSAQRKHTT